MRYAKYFDKDLYSKWHRTIDNLAMGTITIGIENMRVLP